MIVTVRQLNAAMNIAKHFEKSDRIPDGFISFCKETIETLLKTKLNEWDFENEKMAIFIIRTAKLEEQHSKLSRNNQLVRIDRSFIKWRLGR